MTAHDSMTRRMKEIVEILQAPTPPAHIEFTPKKIKENNDGTFSALAIPYVSIDWIRMRLDKACSPFGWSLEAKEVNGLTFAGIGIRIPESDSWVFKWDTGQDEPTIEAGEDYQAGQRMSSRGIFSLCVKRAAYQWGLGRDVRALPPRYNRCEVYKARGKTYFKRWLENPLTKIRTELSETSAGPAETKESEIDKIRNQCLEYARNSCHMSEGQFSKLAELHLEAKGETPDAYRDVWNELVSYRKEMTDLEQSQGYTPKFADVLKTIRS